MPIQKQFVVAHPATVA